MRLEDIEFKDQRTLALVVDIALLLEVAEDRSDSWYGRTCARSAIANAALLLECAANSALFSLALPTKLAEELDKLPALSKLDYFMFARTSEHIDRGCRQTELAADVIKLRDHVVHPKPKTGRITGAEGARFIDYGTTKALGIPFDVIEWDHLSARAVTNAVIDFLSRFFLDWCNLTKGKVTTLLVNREKTLIQSDSETWVQMPAEEQYAVAKQLPNALKFLDLRCASGA